MLLDVSEEMVDKGRGMYSRTSEDSTARDRNSSLVLKDLPSIIGMGGRLRRCSRRLGYQLCRQETKKCDFWQDGDLVGVISETGCSASPDGDLLRNRWKPEDVLLEVFVFKMLSNLAEGDFIGCRCPYMHESYASAELRPLQMLQCLIYAFALLPWH